MEGHGLNKKVSHEYLPKKTMVMLHILTIHFIVGCISVITKAKTSVKMVNGHAFLLYSKH